MNVYRNEWLRNLTKVGPNLAEKHPLSEVTVELKINSLTRKTQVPAHAGYMDGGMITTGNTTCTQ